MGNAHITPIKVGRQNMLTEQTKQALAAKIGADNLKVVEESVMEVGKEYAKQLVDAKAEMDKATKQNGYLSRKVKTLRENLAKILEAQKMALLRMADKFANREVEKRETLIDELTQRHKTIEEEMARNAEVFFEQKAIPAIRHAIEANVKKQDHQRLLESISKVITGTVKRKDSDGEKALKSRIADLQESMMKLAEENRTLRNENVFLKETKELKAKEVEEVKENVDLGSRDSEKRIAEAKKRILERKRRSLIAPKSGQDAAEVVRQKVAKAAPGALTESMMARVVGLAE